MSKYVMSDLHGCYDKFIKLLEKIKFNENDELYILGDIFDRGDKPLEILDYIVTHLNITLLKGNHEKMFEDSYKSGDSGTVAMWMFNGGSTTFQALCERGQDYEKAVYKYISNLPYVEVVDKFILVHAGLFFSDKCDDLSLDEFLAQQNEDNCLWDRSNIGSERKYRDFTVICGHTPVQTINSGKVEIIQRYGTFYIDCGCVFEKANGKLACLRLDDMKEFYVE